MWPFLRLLGSRVLGTIRASATACLRKEGLACAALIASTVGAAVLTGMLGFSLWYLAEANRSSEVFYLACGLLATVAMIIFSLGRVLAGKMSIEAELWKLKFKASNGDSIV